MRVVLSSRENNKRLSEVDFRLGWKGWWQETDRSKIYPGDEDGNLAGEDRTRRRAVSRRYKTLRSPSLPPRHQYLLDLLEVGAGIILMKCPAKEYVCDERSSLQGSNLRQETSRACSIFFLTSDLSMIHSESCLCRLLP